MIDRILESGVIAVVRLRSAAPSLRAAAAALAAGGASAIEITLTTPGALDTIRELTASGGIPGCLVGAGSVLDATQARSVIDAGARFVVSPGFDAEVVRVCRDAGVVCMPGAFTPTEILAAWRAGADAVKVFPSSAIDPSYVRDVLAPMPFLRLVPSGGVTIENAGDWIRSGAAAISAGSALIDAPVLQPGRAAELTARARAFVDRVAEARRAAAGTA